MPTLPSRQTASHPIARRLKQARLEAGLSQRRLGIEAGIEPSIASTRVNQYERQVHQPAFAVVKQLARVLKRPTAFFYTTDDVLAELIELYGILGRAERAKLLDRARKLKS
jgi:transcriptional regulator with XRE-family HTH domain